VDFVKLNPPWISAIFKDHPQHAKLQKAWYPPYMFHAGGGTLGIQKSFHDAVGGFEESLPAHEDTDYCFRVQRRVWI
jgi:GT2 family glycosyltransferase